MTTLISWAAGDDRGHSAVYLASDSRISWNTTVKWDYSRKLFASACSPDIFGYCGDVLFVSQSLSQLLDLIEHGLVLEPGMEPNERFAAIKSYLASALQSYPDPVRHPFSVLYGTRINKSIKSQFCLYRLDWNGRCWSEGIPNLPIRSGVVEYLGSGKASFEAALIKWQNSDIGRTSRSIFGAFCDSLNSGVDPLSGGAPQLVGIYRDGSAKSFGIISTNGKHLFGSNLEGFPVPDTIEWRNEAFERCDGTTKERLLGATRQPRPDGL